ncbi:UNVERIFIED_CONTAM: hypothetical protein FKN15_010902 [Acipenser sinensis]
MKAVERHILAMLHSIKLQVQHNTAVLQSLNPSQCVPSTLLEKPDGIDFLPLEDMVSLDALEERLIQEVELKKAIPGCLGEALREHPHHRPRIGRRDWGEGVYKVLDGGAVRSPGPGTGAAWDSPRAAAVSDLGLARLPYRRAPLMAPVFPPLAEAPRFRPRKTKRERRATKNEGWQWRESERFQVGEVGEESGGGCGVSTGVWLGCLRSGPTRPRAGSHGS